MTRPRRRTRGSPPDTSHAVNPQLLTIGTPRHLGVNPAPGESLACCGCPPTAVRSLQAIGAEARHKQRDPGLPARAWSRVDRSAGQGEMELGLLLKAVFVRGWVVRATNQSIHTLRSRSLGPTTARAVIARARTAVCRPWRRCSFERWLSPWTSNEVAADPDGTRSVRRGRLLHPCPTARLTCRPSQVGWRRTEPDNGARLRYGARSANEQRRARPDHSCHRCLCHCGVRLGHADFSRPAGDRDARSGGGELDTACRLAVGRCHVDRVADRFAPGSTVREFSPSWAPNTDCRLCRSAHRHRWVHPRAVGALQTLVRVREDWTA